MENCTVYILLTRSDTCFSRLIHFATQDRYTHASIGLDSPQGPFYSFGRKHPLLALPAGLVEEQVRLRRQTIPCCLYALEVDRAIYDLLRQRLETMYAQRDFYHYNLLGTLACYLNRPLQRSRHYFCSQFVAGLLQECGAVELPKPPALVRPSDLSRLQGLHQVHQGILEGIPA